MKKTAKKISIVFSSEDSEGTDISFQSSQDELDQRDPNEVQKNIQILKDKMQHFFLENPEFEKNLQLEQPDAKSFDAEFNPRKRQQQGADKKIYSQTPDQANKKLPVQIEEQKNQYANYWKQISSSVLKESKSKIGPSIEYVNKRLNLFRHKVEKPDILEILEAESQATSKKKSESEQQKLQKQIHKKAEDKIRQESGDVQYCSFKKNIQYQFKIQKAEEKMKKNYEKKKEESKKKEQQDKDKPKYWLRLYNQQPQMNESSESIEKEFKSQKSAELYRLLKKQTDEEQIKKTAFKFISEYKKKMFADFEKEGSLFSNIPRFYGDESKEFNTFFPDFSLSKNFQDKKDIQNLLENPEDYSNEDGNVFLLKKMKIIMNSNIMNYWKELQDPQKY